MNNKKEVVIRLDKQVQTLYDSLVLFKPNDRSELDRRFAVATTELEKLSAYITQYIIKPLNE